MVKNSAEQTIDRKSSIVFFKVAKELTVFDYFD